MRPQGWELLPSQGQQLRADCPGHAFLVCSGDAGRGLLCRFFFSCCWSLSSFFFR